MKILLRPKIELIRDHQHKECWIGHLSHKPGVKPYLITKYVNSGTPYGYEYRLTSSLMEKAQSYPSLESARLGAEKHLRIIGGELGLSILINLAVTTFKNLFGNK